MGSIVDSVAGFFGHKAQADQAGKSISDFQNAAQWSNEASNNAFNNQVAAYQPYYDQGTAGLNRASQMQTPGFQYSPSDPSYAFRVGQGAQALDRSAAARGGVFSGGQAKALTRYGQDMASTEFANDFARNNQLAGIGMQGAQGISTANANLATNMQNSFFNAANGSQTARTAKGDATAAQWGDGANIATSVAKFFGI